VVLTYNSARFVDLCFGALSRAELGAPGAEVIAVDNASRDGTVALIRERHPWVTVIENGANLGFAEGNNVGMRAAMQRGAEWVYLLNPDAEVTPGFLVAALEVTRDQPRAGSIQSLLLLGKQPDRINTAGNSIHFLGFGYCSRMGAPVADAPTAPVEIAYGSGAGILLSIVALDRIGLFDEHLFLYHEDLDLGWRLRLAGFTNLLAPASRVLHHYEFSRNTGKYFFMERNRYVVLLKNLAIPSLIVLAPFLLLTEFLLFAVAAGAGWLPEKRRATAALFHRETWRRIARGRRECQATRIVSDSEIAAHFVATIDFVGLPGGWLSTLGALPMRLIWLVIRPLMSRRRMASRAR
jgi:GT2 family glycosyltransferase